MAYTDDAVLAKLSALNESHESIATAAQWIMFHRRHADRTVQLWLQRLKDSPAPKRLNLIYLANEVTQQSKARHKDDFVIAFSPVISDAIAAAYKGAPIEVQGKLRRVIDVWRDRSIFEIPIQSAVEARMEELDKSRSTSKGGSFGGSIFGSSSSMPQELAPLTTPQQHVTKLLLPTKTAFNQATSDYDKLMDPSGTPPPAPVYAARLNGLLKTLANAEGAVAECVKARTELVRALSKLLETNRASLETEEKQLAELTSRKKTVDQTKNEIELAIMRGLSTNDKEQSPGDGAAAGTPPPEPDRPEMEALTPPHIADEPDGPDNGGAPHNGYDHGRPSHSPVAAQPASFANSSAPGIEMLSNLASQYQAVPVSNSVGSNKRRRVDSGDDFPDLGADDGIDADVAEMLRKDSQS